MRHIHRRPTPVSAKGLAPAQQSFVHPALTPNGVRNAENCSVDMLALGVDLSGTDKSRVETRWWKNRSQCVSSGT